MARCNCNTQTCGCRVEQGSGITITGAGSPGDPWVISSEGGGGGGDGGFLPGDLKDTARTDVPAGWLECDGTAKSRTAYAALFNAIGTTWGPGDGFSTFNLPDFRGRFRLGVGPGYPLASSGGASQVTLLTANLPIHAHSIAHTHGMEHTHTHEHTHNVAHTHDMGHDHGVTGSDPAEHAHFIGGDTASNTAGGGTGGRIVDLAGGIIAATASAQAFHTHDVPPWSGHTGTSTISASGGASTVVTSGASSTVTSGASVTNSGSVGADAPFSILPPYRAVRVLIKT